MFNADGRIAIQRLTIDESNGTATAAWEWFGESRLKESLRRVTFGVLVAGEGTAGICPASVYGDLGPLSTVLTAAANPIPRFVPTSSLVQVVPIESETGS